jgi:putative membrane protein
MTDAPRGVRASAVIATSFGLIAAVALLGYFNVGAVLAAMRPIGAGGFAAVVAAQLLLFVPLGLAWWMVALDGIGHLAAFMLGRLSREAAFDVLPFSQFGGVLIGARVAMLGGVTLAKASGSSVVDITIEIIAQLIYTLVGVALLARRLGAGGAGNPLIPALLVGVAIAAGAIALFVVTQRRGLGAIERLVDRLVPALSDRAAEVAGAVQEAYEHRSRLWTALGLHMAGWFGSAAGTWLILRFIGHRLPFLSVAAIESLLFAIRNAAFIVPSGLGVQEGAYALIGPLFGLPAEAALALSLLKRARDVGIGVPAMIAWQLAESGRVLRR